MFTHRRKKLDLHLRSHTKNNSEWITGLRIKTIKLLEENLGVNLHDFGLGNGFLDMLKKKHKQQKKKDKLNCIKIFKNLC